MTLPPFGLRFCDAFPDEGEEVWLIFKRIGDADMILLSPAIASGSLPSLQTLLVDDGPLGTEHHGI